ncbi:hypothetical protein A2974_00315 [Candidatus Peregrinibacteria bacterium RIFCSPLOWO2_01_FULL_48_20]|nr:MAG: hypothetical protein A2974_00315 [Candidatus Peregrinibacteria bacterium RIFCSPLOWO2_01_FULL_48_20]
MIDIKLTQIALKIKNLILIDVSFPKGRFTEFKKAYENRYLHMPCRASSAGILAGGLSNFGKVVVLYGDGFNDCNLPDQTLNVKVLKEDAEGSLITLEEDLKAFGPAVLLIPEED